jgi:GT2 family glycosyltransferase
VPAATPDVTVVIPSYRRGDRLAGLMAALAAQTIDPHRFEVVAVDNASGDDTYDTLTALAKSVPFSLRVLQIDVNQGPAPARNLGWHHATAPIVAFLDDDCLPEPKWLAAGLTALGDAALGVVQGRVRPPDDFNPDAMGHWYHCQIIDGPTPYFEACNIFYRTDALHETGGFDEDIGWWCEDTSAGWKVVDAGWSRGFADGAVVVHEVQPRGWQWSFRNGLLEDNTVRMAARHAGFRREAFWRPWAYRREDAGLVLAVVGLVAGIRMRPALLLALPYLWWRRPRLDQRDPLRLAAQTVAVDAARTTGQLRGAVRYRTFVV